MNQPFCIFVVALLLFTASPAALSASKGDQDRQISATSQTRAVVEQYCYDCHDAVMKEADLALDTLNPAEPAGDAEVWERVLRKLRHRQMPPLGNDRPDEATYNAVITELERKLDAAAEANPNPGRTDTFRRLTRTEYRNAIRDLLAVDIDVSSLLPEDEISHGFDNITVTDLSPTLMERYLAAAKQISRLATGNAIQGPVSSVITIPPDLTQEGHLGDLPFGSRGGAVVAHFFPADGEYEIQLRLMRDRNEQVEGLSRSEEVDLLVNGHPKERFTLIPPKRGEHDQADRHLRVRLSVPAGRHEIGAAFTRLSHALLESERQPTVARFNRDRHPRTRPALHSITVIGPYHPSGAETSPSRERIFVRYPQAASEEDACARQILSRLMRLAYRRPVGEHDLEAPFRFYSETKRTEGFEAGIEMALRAILVSPHFLFKIEPDPTGAAPGFVYPLPDIQLASRLSFFLWSSLPDDELLSVAESGRLREPAELKRQVRRMLADSRANALITNFAAQWLHLRNLASVTPDPRTFLDFDHNLREALRHETELFVQNILRNDRSILELLDADYTYVNERLAKHYGIPHIYGSRFRRVSLDGNSTRGGLLTHGSILTVTSYANRTSPVLRGKWILSNLLGMPPKPPPPEVPELQEKTVAGETLSLRERIAKHREKKSCATCHDPMDPLGFALEQYDAIGRWRLAEDGIPIDASGAMLDGTEFDGAEELQATLLRRPELFAGTVVEKLLTYALGRGVSHHDAPAVRRVLAESAEHEYRFSSLVLEIVRSTPFQMRKAL